MSDAVDHAACKERLRRKVDGDHHDRGHAKEQEQRDDKKRDPGGGPPAIEVALQPIIRRAAPVVLQDMRIVRRGACRARSPRGAPCFSPNTTGLCGSPGYIGVGVVAAVHRDPLARHGSGAEPEPEPEKMSQDRMQHEAAVRLVPVQIERDAEKHQLNQPKADEPVAPKRQLHDPIGKIARSASPLLTPLKENRRPAKYSSTARP